MNKPFLIKAVIIIVIAVCCYGVGRCSKTTSRVPTCSELSPGEQAFWEMYFRMRFDGLYFAKAVAGYWFWESQKTKQYYIFSARESMELYSEETCVSKNGENILSVWFPLPCGAGASQFAIDMCHAYNNCMVGFALDLARNGDFATASRICRQIRNLCPNLEQSYPWDAMELDFEQENKDLQYPETLQDLQIPLLSQGFSDFQKMLWTQRDRPLTYDKEEQVDSP